MELWSALERPKADHRKRKTSDMPPGPWDAQAESPETDEPAPIGRGAAGASGGPGRGGGRGRASESGSRASDVDTEDDDAFSNVEQADGPGNVPGAGLSTFKRRSSVSLDMTDLRSDSSENLLGRGDSSKDADRDQVTSSLSLSVVTDDDRRRTGALGSISGGRDARVGAAKLGPRQVGARLCCAALLLVSFLAAVLLVRFVRGSRNPDELAIHVHVPEAGPTSAGSPSAGSPSAGSPNADSPSTSTGSPSAHATVAEELTRQRRDFHVVLVAVACGLVGIGWWTRRELRRRYDAETVLMLHADDELHRVVEQGMAQARMQGGHARNHSGLSSPHLSPTPSQRLWAARQLHGPNSSSMSDFDLGLDEAADDRIDSNPDLSVENA